jgi:hypothetical protein
VGIGFFGVEVSKGRLVMAIQDRKAPSTDFVGQASGAIPAQKQTATTGIR